MVWRIDRFKGEYPRKTARHLAYDEAREARDAFLNEGTIRPIGEPQDVNVAIADDIKTIYRFTEDQWFTWDVDVDVVPAPVASDTTRRTLWTGDGAPKQTSLTIAGPLSGSGTPVARTLGIQAPTQAPTVATDKPDAAPPLAAKLAGMPWRAKAASTGATTLELFATRLTGSAGPLTAAPWGSETPWGIASGTGVQLRITGRTVANAPLASAVSLTFDDNANAAAITGMPWRAKAASTGATTLELFATRLTANGAFLTTAPWGSGTPWEIEADSEIDLTAGSYSETITLASAVSVTFDTNTNANAAAITGVPWRAKATSIGATTLELFATRLTDGGPPLTAAPWGSGTPWEIEADTEADLTAGSYSETITLASAVSVTFGANTNAAAIAGAPWRAEAASIGATTLELSATKLTSSGADLAAAPWGSGKPWEIDAFTRVRVHNGDTLVAEQTLTSAVSLTFDASSIKLSLPVPPLTAAVTAAQALTLTLVLPLTLSLPVPALTAAVDHYERVTVTLGLSLLRLSLPVNPLNSAVRDSQAIELRLGLPLRLSLPVPALETAVAALERVTLLLLYPDALDDQTPSEFVSWVYTFVSDLDEEGPPSPASTLLERFFKQDGTLPPVTLSDMETGVTGAYSIAHKRIYRTVVGAGGETAYHFVKTVAATVDTTIDDVPTVSVGDELRTLTWQAPPANLSGLTALPNGVLAGFVDRTLWLSEPYEPHAWPPEYTLVMDYPIVALGVYGTTVVVLTTGVPYLVDGVHPQYMTQSKLELDQACIAKRSVTRFGNTGILYASPDGLVQVGPGTAQVITREIFNKGNWDALHPKTIRAVYHDENYLAFHDGGMFALMQDMSGVSHFSDVPSAFFQDRERDALYVVEDGELREWSTTSPTGDTAELTVLGNIPMVSGTVQGFTEHDGALYAVDHQELWRIDPITPAASTMLGRLPMAGVSLVSHSARVLDPEIVPAMARTVTSLHFDADGVWDASDDTELALGLRPHGSTWTSICDVTTVYIADTSNVLAPSVGDILVIEEGYIWCAKRITRLTSETRGSIVRRRIDVERTEITFFSFGYADALTNFSRPRLGIASVQPTQNLYAFSAAIPATLLLLNLKLPDLIDGEPGDGGISAGKVSLGADRYNLVSFTLPSGEWRLKTTRSGQNSSSASIGPTVPPSDLGSARAFQINIATQEVADMMNRASIGDILTVMMTYGGNEFWVDYRIIAMRSGTAATGLVWWLNLTYKEHHGTSGTWTINESGVTAYLDIVTPSVSRNPILTTAPTIGSLPASAEAIRGSASLGGDLFAVHTAAMSTLWRVDAEIPGRSSTIGNFSRQIASAQAMTRFRNRLLLADLTTPLELWSVSETALDQAVRTAIVPSTQGFFFGLTHWDGDLLAIMHLSGESQLVRIDLVSTARQARWRSRIEAGPLRNFSTVQVLAGSYTDIALALTGDGVERMTGIVPRSRAPMRLGYMPLASDWEMAIETRDEIFEVRFGEMEEMW